MKVRGRTKPFENAKSHELWIDGGALRGDEKEWTGSVLVGVLRRLSAMRRKRPNMMFYVQQ